MINTLLHTVIIYLFLKALNRPNNTNVYAQLCALLIKDKKFNTPLLDSNKTFLTLLIPKCRNLLYNYKTNTRVNVTMVNLIIIIL